MYNPKIVKPPTTRKNTYSIKVFRQIDNITNEGLLNLATPIEMYNMHNIGGKLTDGLGIDKATITTGNGLGFFDIPAYTGESGINQIFVYPRYDRELNKEDNLLIARTHSGNFYKVSLSVPNSTWVKIDNFNYTEKATAISYSYDNKDVMLLCSKANLLSIYDGNQINFVTNAPKISSMCEHYGRIFASVYGEGKEIWFSDNYNPNNWSVSLTEAGYIKFSDSLGKAIKVVSFNDYLYIFREHAIFRLTAYGDQSKFELNKVLEINSNIYENSIVLCKDRIVFLCFDGLYDFDGFNTKKVGENISMLEEIRENYISADYANGHYYLSFYHPIDDTYHDEVGFYLNNMLLDYDIVNNQIEFSRGMNIIDITSVNINNTAKCYVVANGVLPNAVGMLSYNAKYHNTDLKSYFRSIKYYFSEKCRSKLIKKIRIYSAYNCKLTLITDSGETSYNIEGKSVYQEIRINKKCKWVQLKIEANTKLDIEGIELDIEMVRK